MSAVEHSTLEEFVTRIIDDLGDWEVVAGIYFVNGFALRYRDVNPVPVEQIQGILDRFVHDKRLMVLYGAGTTKETACLSDAYYKRVLPPLRSA